MTLPSSDLYVEAAAETKRRTMTIKETAEAFGIGITLATELAGRDELPVPVFKLGGRYVVSRAAVDAVLGAPQIAMPAKPSTPMLDLLIGLRDLAEMAIAAMESNAAAELAVEHTADRRAS